MRKSTIWLLASVMVFAFIGLLFLQANYIYIILNTQEEQFKDAVKRSLYEVSHNLELDETTQFLTDQFFTFGKKYGSNKKVSVVPKRINIREQQRLSVDGSNQQLSSQIEINIRGNLDSLYSLSPSFGKNDINTASRSIQEALQNQYLYRQNLLEEVIRRAARGSQRPIEERMDFNKLESYIRTELANNNLAIPFVFAVLDKEKNVIYKSTNYENLKDAYSQILFPQDPSNKLYTLQVAFPTQKKYVLDSVSFIIPSIIFTIVLLFVFTFTIYIVFRQRRLSELKNDFINNMTHELKTPVASISLAAQTLNDADVSNSPYLMEHAKKVINDESKRLGFLVEKVLQMSLFEDGATHFKMVKLDVNDLITSIVSTFVLRVENVGGTLDVDFEALNSTIVVDKMHFTNVLFNLMENAVKYRRENVPLLLIARTLNVEDKVQIIIEDNGLGIRKEGLKKIFDRFYRVPTGNKHDVKGFGLGLAYVKRIIDGLGGTIKAESEYGEGTKFIITMAYVDN